MNEEDRARLREARSVKYMADMFGDAQADHQFAKLVAKDELENLEKGLDKYTEEHARQAAVHGRHDVAMLVRRFARVEKKLKNVALLVLIVGAICLAVLVVQIFL